MRKNKKITKIALSFSIVLIVIWAIIGANASVAWFNQSDSIINILNFGSPIPPGPDDPDDPDKTFDVKLYHKTDTGYEEVDSTTKVFDEAALYEPGYTQLVYLRIDNAGDIDFTYDMTIVPDLSSEVVGKNVYGEDIYLHEHLKFGFIYDETENGLMEKTADRDLARKCATHKLSNFSENGGTLSSGNSNYCALILYMPEEVSNEANYRGDKVPSVKVGIGAVANQIS